jgi:hypothetical protein
MIFDTESEVIGQRCDLIGIIVCSLSSQGNCSELGIIESTCRRCYPSNVVNRWFPATAPMFQSKFRLVNGYLSISKSLKTYDYNLLYCHRPTLQD